MDDFFTNEYRYECSHGHLLESCQPIDRCPGRRRDRPCDGMLRAYGPGSVKENERLTTCQRRARANA